MPNEITEDERELIAALKKCAPTWPHCVAFHGAPGDKSGWCHKVAFLEAYLPGWTDDRLWQCAAALEARGLAKRGIASVGGFFGAMPVDTLMLLSPVAAVEPERPEGDATEASTDPTGDDCPAGCICNRIPPVPDDEDLRDREGWLSTAGFAELQVEKRGLAMDDDGYREAVQRAQDLLRQDRKPERCREFCKANRCGTDHNGKRFRLHQGRNFYQSN